MVGTTGFEPATSCTPSKRANQAAPRPDRAHFLGGVIISLWFNSANSSSSPRLISLKT